ncbi:MAG: SoxR reducing system RseC family protein, partial [Candidatus Geothermincolia bacterium]
MLCTGTVVGRQDGIALVHIESQECDHCQACGFGAVRDKKAMEVRAQNDIGARIGDRIQLEVSGKKIMSASAIMFLIPFGGFILGLLLGFGLAYLLGLDSWATPLGLVLGVVLMALSYRIVRTLGNKTEFEFVIKDFVSEP